MSSNVEFLPLFMANVQHIRGFVRTLVHDPREVDDVFQAVALVLSFMHGLMNGIAAVAMLKIGTLDSPREIVGQSQE